MRSNNRLERNSLGLHGCSSGTEILPLGWLIRRNCRMNDDFTILTTPKGRELHVIQRDALPYLSKKDVVRLFEDLPEACEIGRDGMAAMSVTSVVCSMRMTACAVNARIFLHCGLPMWRTRQGRGYLAEQ